MNIQLGGWQDNCGIMREQIVRDVIDIMFCYFHNDALFKNDLQIIDIHTANCPWADENPCTHFDRSRICLNVQGTYWCQFIHQLSHELCHCSTSRHQLPQKIKWFDEFICCCSSYLVETIISLDRTHRYDYMFPGRAAEVFGKYLRTKIDGNIYVVENTTEFFAVNRKKYEANQNLIKSHEVYIRSFFEALNGDFSGLSFVGKMYLVQTNDDMIIEEFLQKLLILCDTNEKLVIYQICKLFGIKLARQMKDSEIAWVGEIPQEWQTMPLYCLYTERKNINALGKEDNLLSLSYGKVIRKDINTSEGLLPSNYNGYNIVECDDIVIRPTDLQNDKRSLRTGLAKERGIITSAYIALKPKQGVNSRFFHYLLHSYDISKVFYNMGNGVRQGLNYDEFAKLIVLVPSDSEQQRIADFLDKECEKIDELKADIGSQIDTLEQYKRSVITEAVTHGINPDAPMKDSGIAWMGEAPTHWERKKGKYVLTLLSRPIKQDDGVITCFRDGEVTLRSNRREEGFTMADKEIGYQGVNIGDLVVHGMDGFAGAIGISDSRGKASPVLNVLDTEQNKKYVMYYLRSMAYNDVFTALSTGIRVRSCDLRWNKLAELLYPLPPIDEQKQIVEYIDNQLARTNEVIADKKAQLETLDEYKKSLIYEYVTGKKEVV